MPWMSWVLCASVKSLFLLWGSSYCTEVLWNTSLFDVTYTSSFLCSEPEASNIITLFLLQHTPSAHIHNGRFIMWCRQIWTQNVHKQILFFFWLLKQASEPCPNLTLGSHLLRLSDQTVFMRRVTAHLPPLRRISKTVWRSPKKCDDRCSPNAMLNFIFPLIVSLWLNPTMSNARLSIIKKE